MPKRVKFGHHYYYIVLLDDLKDNKFRGKNVVLEGVIEDKPTIEFLPMELPSYRTIFRIDGLKIEFSGTPHIGRGDRVRVYGRFVGDGIIAKAIETEKALYISEE
ncbi:MAG TPA: GTP-binding protein [Thermococcus paralvinellae]|uniref:GTP-binding protein n=1 Tax=Thermococcus paralvinellae TaxID=582419 RepID=A0A832Z9J5_9EURY|nr:GTP-binding protein [Thermococcus paralvinellae]HIP89669.1 GTP-binding protein [Thermococcus paralvinellae]